MIIIISINIYEILKINIEMSTHWEWKYIDFPWTKQK